MNLRNQLWVSQIMDSRIARFRFVSVEISFFHAMRNLIPQENAQRISPISAPKLYILHKRKPIPIKLIIEMHYT